MGRTSNEELDRRYQQARELILGGMDRKPALAEVNIGDTAFKRRNDVAKEPLKWKRNGPNPPILVRPGEAKPKKKYVKKAKGTTGKNYINLEPADHLPKLETKNEDGDTVAVVITKTTNLHNVIKEVNK